MKIVREVGEKKLRLRKLFDLHREQSEVYKLRKSRAGRHHAFPEFFIIRQQTPSVTLRGRG